jgi:uncharacterized membrane protein
MLSIFAPEMTLTPDLLAVGFLVAAWMLCGWLTEHPPAGRPSVTLLMERYRREWMQAFVTRQPRIFDAQLIDSLRQGTAFLASASMIAIGGGLALMGNPAMLENLASELPFTTGGLTHPTTRILVVILFLANALLKFVWAHRLFGYCTVLMAAVPNDAGDPVARHRAAQAGEINITAGKSYNRGLRSIYFALAALSWLLGNWPLVAATLAATLVLLRREFASHSRMIVAQDDPPA